MPSIIDLFDAESKAANLIPKDFSLDKISRTGGDKTPYYSDEAKGTLDDKAVDKLESSIGSRYGKGVGNWGAVYNDQKGKKYSEQAKKD